MSDDVLSVIPADPRWRPSPEAGERTRDAVLALVAGGPPHQYVRATWHEECALVDCGANLERIGCPVCGGDIDPGWWEALVHGAGGFGDLGVTVPCCGASTALDRLDYDWPCGFASFEIAVWNPDVEWFTDAEMAALGEALGHPVRQIRAHI